MKAVKKRPHDPHKPVTLKAVAERVQLTPGTVSAVLNDSPAAKSIPEHTRARIIEAARELNYRPNFLARSLRVQRTYMVGVIAEEIGEPYGGGIISGVEAVLRENNYLFLTVAHHHEAKLLDSYSSLLSARGVEGFITIDTSIAQQPQLPTVALAGHQNVENVTNIVLDHYRAAELGLMHLKSLGHRQIAFIKGQPTSSDSETRWDAIGRVAQKLEIEIRPELVKQLQGDDFTPELGVPSGRSLMAQKVPFTALFAYNDISAIGCMRAFQEAGLNVPRDISVVGFDDIPIASFSIPPLTTVRQPLSKMGRIAGETLLRRIEGLSQFVPEIRIEPELVVRGSTAGPRHG